MGAREVNKVKEEKLRKARENLQNPQMVKALDEASREAHETNRALQKMGEFPQGFWQTRITI